MFTSVSALAGKVKFWAALLILQAPLLSGAQLSISSATVTQGGKAHVTVSYAGQGASAGTISFDLLYDATALPTVTATPGTSATAAGKSVQSGGVNGNKRFLVVNVLDLSTLIPDGPVAELTFDVAPNAPSGIYPLTLANGQYLDDTGKSFDLTLVNGAINVGNVSPPALGISKTHSGNFTQGQQGASYTVTVNNAVGAGPTNGAVTVTETLPAGFTLVSMSGSGWTCPLGNPTCTRSDVLAPGASYPPITVTVNVSVNATSPQVNSVSVSGGGAAAASATDSTAVTQLASLGITKTHSGSFTQGQSGATYSIVVSNSASAGPTSGTVTVTDTIPAGLTLVSMSGAGWTCPAGGNTCTRNDVLAAGGIYPPITVTVNVAANAVSPVVNGATVSGGGSATASTTDVTVVGKPAALSVTKTHSGNFTQGQTGAQYTVTVSNNAAAGPTAGTVSVVDVVTSGLTLVSMSGSGWTCPAGGNTCTRSDVLTPGSSYPPITVTVNVATNATSPQDNAATVSGGGSANATATDSTTIDVSKPVLGISKIHTGGFTQGQTGVNYLISVSNGVSAGPTSGTVTVTDTVPAGLTLVSLSGTGWTCPAGGNTCSRNDVLTPGNSYPMITVTVNVAADATSPLVNTATVSGGGSVSATTTDSTIVGKLPVLSISKTHTGNFTAGQAGAVYSVVVSNNASAGPTNGTVTVTDTVPSGLTLVSMSGAGWTCAGGNTCTRSDVLNAGSSYPPVTVTVNVADNATSPLVNTASVSGGGSASASATDSTTIDPKKPVLSISKTHAGTFTAGSTGVYTVTVGNSVSAGPTNGTVTVTETVPSGLTLVSMSGTGWTCAAGGNTCTRSDVLNAGNSYPPITVTVNVAANATSPLVNAVSVSGGGSATASATDSTVIGKPPVLSITKTHSGNFTQGQSGALYSLTVSNGASAGPTTGAVTVTDTVPAVLTLVSLSGAGWTCPAGGNTCTRSDVLAAGASYPAITATVNVASNATSPQANAASVSGGGSASASVIDSTTIDTPGKPALTIGKTHAGNFKQGQTAAIYTVTVSNGASGTATSGLVTVNDIVPAGLALVSLSGAGWTCPAGGNTCTRSDVLNPGTSYPPITVTVNVAADAGTPLTNTANVSGGNSATATATDSTTIDVNKAVLGISKTHSGTFTQGQTGVPYTVTVGNSVSAGPTSGTVTVTDTVPAGLTLVSMTGPGWTCPTPGNTCTRSDVLNPGSAYPAITVIVNVAANATSPQVNTVTVSGGGSATATATDSTTIGNAPVLSITKTHTGNFTPGQTGGQYTLTVSNALSAAASSGTVTVTDTVPAGLTLVSLSGTGWICPAGGNTCTRNDVLNPGSSYPPITVTVNVANNATSPQVNTASVSGGGSGTATVTDSTAIISPVSITGPASLPQGQVGVLYSQQITASGGNGSFTFSATGLPAGLNIDPTSGIISGTPTTSGGSPFSVTVTATDTSSAKGSKAYSLVILPASGVSLSAGSGTGSPGQTVEIPIALGTSGGGAPVSFTLDASFDQQQLTFVSARKGEQLTSAGKDLATQVQQNSDVRLSSTGAGQTVIPNGNVAYVTFRLNNQFTSGTATITLKNCQAADAQSQPISTTCTAGTITAFVIRVNAGGPDYTDPATGAKWSADFGFTGGTPFTTSQNIANTTTVPLYQTDRNGATVQYQFASVPAGNYTVKLKFAELALAAAGKRVFNIGINGQTVQPNFDIVAQAGSPFTAFDVSYPVAVTDGQITILLTGVVDNAAINAIEITAGSGAPAALSIAKSHISNFAQTQTGATYTVTVSNGSGAGPTAGTVKVTETVPPGLTLVSMAGTGWTCNGNVCLRNDPLTAGSSYPPITVTVNVAANATTPQVNAVTVSGGGSASATAMDSTVISGPSAVTLPTGVTVGPGDSANFVVTLTKPAPPEGVFVSLTSSDPNVVSIIPANVFIRQGETQSTQPRVTGVHVGTATITATVFGLPSVSQVVQVIPNMTLSFAPPTLTITGTMTQNLTLTLVGGVAPNGGLTVNLSSSNPTIATVPATVTFRPSTNSILVPVTPIMPGTVTIHVSALPNLMDTTAQVIIKGQ